MRSELHRCLVVVAGLIGAAVQAAPVLPYAQAGLSERQAAELLLDRVGHGARPGEVDRVLAQGLPAWLEQQLRASAPETALEAQFQRAPARYRAMGLDAQQLIATYPDGQRVAAEARRSEDLIPPPDTPVDAAWRARKLAQFKQARGYLDPERELYQQLVDQKLTRALLSSNPLQERLVDFWQNHFYASSAHFRSRPWVLLFEVQAVRPRALGHFRDLLGAAVQHPAILQLHRDGALPAGSAPTLMQATLQRLPAPQRAACEAAVQADVQALESEEALLLQRRFWPGSGPNPVLAEALLGLYTLGPQGGWQAADVNDTARLLSGWSSVPIGPSPQWFTTGFAASRCAGFEQAGLLLWRADQHDAQAKQVLGQAYPAGGGRAEGERLLDQLARHPATATHLAGKLVRHFVGEDAPPALTQRLAQRWRRSEGDIAQVMQALFESPEFWQQAAQRRLVKTPWEYVVSALRSRDAQVDDVQGLVDWLTRMGQKPCAYLDVGGLPPADARWLQPAALRVRWAFAEQLGQGRIEGVRLDTAGLSPDRLALLVLQWAGPSFQTH